MGHVCLNDGSVHLKRIYLTNFPMSSIFMVDNPYSVIFLIRTPLFECDVVWCGS